MNGKELTTRVGCGTNHSMPKRFRVWKQHTGFVCVCVCAVTLHEEIDDEETSKNDLWEVFVDHSEYE